MPASKQKQKPTERLKLPLETKLLVLTECGYRCAVPTCRQILALDIHHIWEVKSGGGDVPTNLVALCPTCHALYHRGTIDQSSIYAYKAMLISLSQAFDVNTIDDLLFLEKLKPESLLISGDGVLKFSKLIASDLALFGSNVYTISNNSWGSEPQQQLLYYVSLTEKGRLLLGAWKSGDIRRINSYFSSNVPAPDA